LILVGFADLLTLYREFGLLEMRHYHRVVLGLEGSGWSDLRPDGGSVLVVIDFTCRSASAQYGHECRMASREHVEHEMYGLAWHRGVCPSNQ